MEGKEKGNNKERIQNQEKVWDAIAEQWYHFRHQQFRDVSKEIKKLAKLRRGKIIEIGCGNCRNLKTFALNGFDCYGIDFSKEMLKYAHKYCKKHNFKVKLKKARAENLPFKSNTFDYVLCIAVLHHLKQKKQEKVVKEIARVLKNKGFAIISVWNNKDNNKENIKIKEKYIAWQVKNKKYWRYYYTFTLNELCNLFERFNFKIISKKSGKNIILLAKIIK